MAGAIPKPTALKVLQGNPGKRPLNQAEPQVDTTIPRCPAWLSTEARAEWKRMARKLHAAGILTSVDRAALAAYCHSWSRWVDAESHLATGDLVIVSDKGGSYQSPWVSISRQAMTDMLKICVEFGLTPSSRSRIKLASKAEDLSLAEQLFVMAQNA